LFAEDGEYRALLAVSLDTTAGPSTLEVTATDRAGNAQGHAQPVEVLEGTYLQRGRIRLTRTQKSARRDEAAKAIMRAERDAAYAWGEPVASLHAGLQPPIVARETSPFGAYRRYNDGTRSHHTGLDLAHRRGSTIRAAASGTVLVAHPQALFGNAVIIGHGQGVTTSYNHLDRIDVTIGSRVRAGDPIGLLGSTGQSTGPHLHFGVTVAGVAVDPRQWLDGNPAIRPRPR
jgi:murein DD-endopeptidase MepM/ murein hydrolase activator NlpD